MLIRYACSKDKPELKNIWQKCFSDSEKFVNWNFENNFVPENAMLCEEKGSLVSNLHLIPYDVVFCGKVLKAVYISAVATKEDKRNNGYASKLIEASLSDLEKKGIDIAFLVPAIDGYYEKFGFVKIVEKEEFIKKGEIPPYSEGEKTQIPNANEVLQIYLKANKKKKLYLKRSLKDTSLILADLTENTEGECVMTDDGTAYAMYKEYEDKIKVFEIMGENEEAQEYMLFELYKLGKPLEFELPPVMVKPLNKKIKAEDFLLPRKDLYFNLIL